MEKREKVLAVGVGVAAFVFVFNQFVCSSKPEATEAASSAKQKTEVAGSRATRVGLYLNRKLVESRRKRWQTTAFAGWDRNPFAGGRTVLDLITVEETGRDTSAARGDSTEALALNGLLWGVGEPVALIGDLILREREQAGDLQVLKIGPDYVICRKKGEIHRLELPGPLAPSTKRVSP